MSMLHPFKESFDERKNLIIEGEQGIKEIDYLYNGHKYEIVHYYGKGAKSFIKKDGVILNKDGGVQTCEDYILKELEVSKEYTKIGKLGSNSSKTFVNQTTTERKKYIGTFLNIDDILEKYKIVKNKSSILKKELDSMSLELKKFKTSDEIKTEITNLKTKLESAEHSLEKLLPEKGALENQIKIDNAEIGNSNLDELISRKKQKEDDVKTNLEIKHNLENENSNISNDTENFKNKLNEEIISLQSDIKVNNEKINSLSLLIIDEENQIDSKNIEISSLGKPGDLNILNNEIDSLKNEIDKLKDSIKNNKISKIISDAKKENKNVHSYLEKFITFSEFIEKYYTDLNKNYNNTEKVINLFFKDDFEASLERQIKNSREVIQSKKDMLENKKKEYFTRESHLSQLDNLNKRPIDCKIDVCPFIREALKYKNIIPEMEQLKSEVFQIKKDLELLDVKAENIQEILNLYKNFKIAYANLLPRDNFIYNYFLNGISLEEKICGSLSDFQRERIQVKEDAENAINDLSEFVTALSNIRIKETTKASLENVDNSLKESYEKQIEESNKKILKYKESLDKIKNDNLKLQEELTSKNELFNKYSDYLSAISKYASASVMLSTTNSEINKLNECLDRKNKSNNRLLYVNNEITRLQNIKLSATSNINDLTANLGHVENLNKKLNELTKMSKPLEKVLDALSPTTGIPLILIKMYLDETEKIANDLLSVAYGDTFKIKFVATEKEFSIMVEAKDNIKPDIKMASQGEIALTTISLSLALIEQSIGHYNILCLDEIDGALDVYNKDNFINILEAQIEKLGIEQVFVISHNDAFDIAATDLILLKDNFIDKTNLTFMKNKTILFDYEEE